MIATEYDNLVKINSGIKTGTMQDRLDRANANINYTNTPQIKKYQRLYISDDDGFSRIVAAC